MKHTKTFSTVIKTNGFYMAGLLGLAAVVATTSMGCEAMETDSNLERTSSALAAEGVGELDLDLPESSGPIAYDDEVEHASQGLSFETSVQGDLSANLSCGGGTLGNVVRYSATVPATLEHRFTLQLPPGSYDVWIRIDGTGDADLYTGIGTSPSITSYACRPYRWGSNESCNHDGVRGALHVMVRGWAPSSKYNLSVTYRLRDADDEPWVD